MNPLGILQGFGNQIPAYSACLHEKILVRMAKRAETLTRKVPTPFGVVFVHVSRAEGAPAEVWFSMPGRRHSTEVHESLDALAAAIN